MERITLTKKQVEAVEKLNADLQKFIDSGEAQERPWAGSRELINPKTGEVVGTQETANINIIVDVKMYERVKATLAGIKNSGSYVRANFYGMELVAIQAYEGRVSGSPEIQFTAETQKRTNAHGSEEAKAQFAKVFNGELKTMKVGEKVTVKADDEESPF